MFIFYVTLNLKRIVSQNISHLNSTSVRFFLHSVYIFTKRDTRVKKHKIWIKYFQKYIQYIFRYLFDESMVHLYTLIEKSNYYKWLKSHPAMSIIMKNSLWRLILKWSRTCICKRFILNYVDFRFNLKAIHPTKMKNFMQVNLCFLVMHAKINFVQTVYITMRSFKVYRCSVCGARHNVVTTSCHKYRFE